MKILAVLVPMALMSLPVMADDLVLKDGKKIEWKTLVDSGDIYEIVTPSGTKLTVKKTDVDRLSQKPLETPLTGASITFEKKRKLETIDLLTKINPKSGLGGTWKTAAGALTGTAGPLDFSRIPTSFSPSEEYDLYATVEKKDTGGETFIGLTGGGKQFIFYLDGKGGTWAGLMVVGGDTLNISNQLGVVGKTFEKGTPRKLHIMVRKNAFVVQVDGKDVFTWEPDWQKLSMHQDMAVVEKNVVFFGVRAGVFQFSQICVIQPTK